MGRSTAASAQPRFALIRLPLRFWLAAIPLSTGAGLIVHVVSDVSLALAVALSLTLAVVLVLVVVTRLPRARRSDIRNRILVGAAAGLLATFAYDAVRLVVVTLIPMAFWPFDAIQMFGQLLAGRTAGLATTAAVGIAYHLMNGTCFGIAYALIVSRPGVRTAVVWAAGLEVLMVSIYPGWLQIRAMDEFLSVSVAGHAAYGITLGALSTRALGWVAGRSTGPIHVGAS